MRSNKTLLTAAGLLFLALVILIPGCGSSQTTPGGSTDSGKEIPPAPSFTKRSINTNEMISIGDLKGKPVVLNFAASWCGPCESEAPVLVKAHQKYGNEIAFIGLAVKDSEADQLAFAQKHGLTFPIGLDENGRILNEYQTATRVTLSGIPTTFFIDAEGNIANYFIGPLSENTLEQKVASIKPEEETRTAPTTTSPSTTTTPPAQTAPSESQDEPPSATVPPQTTPPAPGGKTPDTGAPLSSMIVVGLALLLSGFVILRKDSKRVIKRL